MPTNLSMFQNAFMQPKSVAEYANDFGQIQNNALARTQSQMQIDAAKRATQQEDAYNQLAKGFGTDIQSNVNALRQGGLGARADTYLKAAQDAQEKAAKTAKDMAETEATKYKLQRTKYENGINVLVGSQTPQDAIARIKKGVTDGAWSMQEAQQKIGEIPQDPNQFQDWRQRELLGIVSAKDQIEHALSLQQLAETVRHNTTSEGLTKRGQNMVDARTREANQANMSKPFEVTGQDGQPMLVQQDKQGNIRPVQGYGPKAQPDKPLNDSQSKALLFGSRAREADNVLAKLANDGTNASIPGSRAPIVGGIINAFQGGNQQSLDQAKRDFMTAVLRRESGASIAPSEFDTADKQYFPQVGDSEKVIKQKAANRRLVIDGILSEVPEKQRGSLTTPTQQNASADPKPAPANLPKSNSKGWALHVDAKGNRAYVSPDGKQYEEVK